MDVFSLLWSDLRLYNEKPIIDSSVGSQNSSSGVSSWKKMKCVENQIRIRTEFSVVVHHGLLLITYGCRPIPTSRDGPKEVL
jgi:hypothetical protein